MTRRASSRSSKRRNDPGRPTVVVVGAGIVGLAHAWAAAKRGCKVTVLERDVRARGASVRNFGMVWPIGQPNGLNHRTALASRLLWLEFLGDSQIWHQESGSLHLAYREDELSVLQDFAKHSQSVGYEC
ncbi:MAG: FAD-dependent oxidoreductase, partial [Planctomycetota bacterium]